MANVLITIIIVVILIAAIAYIIKAKKSGQKCIGCPASATCGAKKDSAGCCCATDDK